ncbi:F-box only protein 15-like [Corythoichthys intestinalis]|uniref:F-box only protein 15-like n=1 Tax=Corythoichthys intestinalis TaxID=161448 RepID=UPI0025A58B1B|nr:F-box only protein 15-like [Corythoichthys intestinalis]XP_057710693.1 F-box only protein 15-like [Corythoichthys intestinalis]
MASRRTSPGDQAHPFARSPSVYAATAEVERSLPVATFRRRPSSSFGRNSLTQKESWERSAEERPSEPPFRIALETLPPEMLLKILSHLDAGSLLSLGRVNKFFRSLANDEVTWCKIHAADLGREVREPDSEPPPGGWKKHYLWKMGGEELRKWKTASLSDPLTGLPQNVRHILRNINASFEVTLRESTGREAAPKLTCVSVFKTSVTLTFDRSHLVRRSYLDSIRLSAVRIRPGGQAPWRSLICRTDPDRFCALSRFLGKDGLFDVISYPPSFIVGFWRCRRTVAFVMVCLHLDKLLERSLLGTPLSPYWEPESRLRAPPESRAYTLHLGLHDTAREIASMYYHPLSSAPGRSITLRPIRGDDVSQHRPLTGDLKLLFNEPRRWLHSCFQNCCVMTLTVQAEGYKPLWCFAAPVSARPVGRLPRGRHVLLSHRDRCGQAALRLVYEKELRCFFAIDLAVTVF